MEKQTISTHALREEGDRPVHSLPVLSQPISTHALREEGDGLECRALFGVHDFYPRPPRGGRLGVVSLTVTNNGFLPTPSARRATLALSVGLFSVCTISTHALREEGDLAW